MAVKPTKRIRELAMDALDVEAIRNANPLSELQDTLLNRWAEVNKVDRSVARAKFIAGIGRHMYRSPPPWWAKFPAVMLAEMPATRQEAERDGLV